MNKKDKEVKENKKDIEVKENKKDKEVKEAKKDIEVKEAKKDKEVKEATKTTIENYNEENSKKFNQDRNKSSKGKAKEFKRIRKSKIRKFFLLTIYILVILVGLLTWAKIKDNELMDVNEQMQIFKEPAYELPIKEELITPTITNEQASADYSEQMIGYVSIPAIGLKVPIMQSSSGENEDMQKVMNQTVAHDPQTSLPGEGGNILLTGHREEQFGDLQNIAIGDLVIVVIQENTYLYKVRETKIIDESGDTSFDYVYDSPEQEQLTMFTCYPFRWYTIPNKRWVVKADRIAEYNEEIDFRDEE
ncbi:MAG: class D sortase [Mycoplasmatales bacterium]